MPTETEKKTRKEITDLLARNAKVGPGQSRLNIKDTVVQGFTLRVTAAGAKSFAMMMRDATPPMLRSACRAAVFALRSALAIISSQSIACFILLLLHLVDRADDPVCLRPRMPCVDAAPLRLRFRRHALGRHGPRRWPLMDRREALDASIREGAMRDHRGRAVAPFPHHRIVHLGPCRGRRLHRALPRHAEDAARPTATASAKVRVDRDEMEMRVMNVVAVLIVDSRDIAGDAPRQSLGEDLRQGLPLRLRGFDRQGDDETLADPPTARNGAALGFRRRLGVGLGHPFADDDAGRLRARDVAEMGRRLAKLRRARLVCSLL